MSFYVSPYIKRFCVATMLGGFLRLLVPKVSSSYRTHLFCVLLFYFLLFLCQLLIFVSLLSKNRT